MKNYRVAIVCWRDKYDSDTDYIKDFWLLRSAYHWLEKHKNELLAEYKEWLDEYEEIDADIEKWDEHDFIDGVVYTTLLYKKENN